MRKVSVIGAGHVGSTVAYALLLRNVCADLSLVDLDVKKAEGNGLDLEHCQQFLPPFKLTSGSSYSLCKNASVVVITASTQQPWKTSRYDLLEQNSTIIKEIMQKIYKYAPNAVVVITTNPVDAITQVAINCSKYPETKIFGTGTALDTARLNQRLARHYNISTQDVHAHVLGEHGDSSFVAWSGARIGKTAVGSMSKTEQDLLQELFIQTQNTGKTIISQIGHTSFAIGIVTAELVRAVLNDSNEIFPVSTMVRDYCGIRDVSMSIPCMIGKNGIAKQLPLSLTKVEQTSLARSAETIRACGSHAVGLRTTDEVPSVTSGTDPKRALCRLKMRPWMMSDLRATKYNPQKPMRMLF
ncbi:MAG: L-lactate dehydrogenase [Candidatus Burarchaeum sp.]|nr:L-lactate dehydrogenase [Candidatus Burarchaeum sp.]MDO8339723.1 L-lactate dehydrogenase [Candidatus Burarchaeum sp.]